MLQRKAADSDIAVTLMEQSHNTYLYKTTIGIQVKSTLTRNMMVLKRGCVRIEELHTLN